MALVVMETVISVQGHFIKILMGQPTLAAGMRVTEGKKDLLPVHSMELLLHRLPLMLLPRPPQEHLSWIGEITLMALEVWLELSVYHLEPILSMNESRLERVSFHLAVLVVVLVWSRMILEIINRHDLTVPWITKERKELMNDKHVTEGMEPLYHQRS